MKNTILVTVLGLVIGVFLVIIINIDDVGKNTLFWASEVGTSTPPMQRTCFDCKKYVKAIKQCRAEPRERINENSFVFLIRVAKEYGGDGQFYAFADLLPCLIGPKQI